jgi:broad specificity phosphatase PhoE
MERLFLVRHAESLKNLRDEHGGKGDKLSDNGMEQCEGISSFLQAEGINEKNSVLFWHSMPQIVETAEIICKRNKYGSFCDERLTGLDLGVLAGLSRQKALQLYPQAAERLEQWRKGLLTIDRLVIPGAERPSSFYKRVKSFLDQRALSNSAQNVIIVGTTSAMIMILNIFLLGRDFNFRNYKNYTFHCGSITKLGFKNCKVSIDYLDKTDFRVERETIHSHQESSCP